MAVVAVIPAQEGIIDLPLLSPPEPVKPITAAGLQIPGRFICIFPYNDCVRPEISKQDCNRGSSDARQVGIYRPVAGSAGARFARGARSSSSPRWPSTCWCRSQAGTRPIRLVQRRPCRPDRQPGGCGRRLDRRRAALSLRLHGLPVSGDDRLRGMADLSRPEGRAGRARHPSRHHSRRRMRGGGVRRMRSRDPALPGRRGASRRRRRDHRIRRGERSRGSRQSGGGHPVPARPLPHRRHPVHRAVVARRHGRDGPLHPPDRGAPGRPRPPGKGTLGRGKAQAGAGSPHRGGAQAPVPPQAAAHRTRDLEGRDERTGWSGSGRCPCSSRRRAPARCRRWRCSTGPRRSARPSPPNPSRRSRARSSSSSRISASRPRWSRCTPAPSFTRYELQPSPGLKVSRVTNLAKDLGPIAVHGERAHRGGHSGARPRSASRFPTRSARSWC